MEANHKLDFTHLQAFVAGWNAAHKFRALNHGPDYGAALMRAFDEYLWAMERAPGAESAAQTVESIEQFRKR